MDGGLMLSRLETYLPLDLDRARCLLEKHRDVTMCPGRAGVFGHPNRPFLTVPSHLVPLLLHEALNNLGVPEPRLVSQTYCFFPVRDIYIHTVTSQSPGSLLSQSYKSIRREG